MLRKLASFLGVPLTDAEVEAIRDATSIQKMREHKNSEMVTFEEGRTRIIGKGENQCDEDEKLA